MTENERESKVLFKVINEDGSVDAETLWATNLGNDKYKLDNSPFYAYSVSWEDIIYAPYDDDEQFPTFERVVEKSGNRTIRIIFDPPVEDGNKSDRLLQGLVELGCSYEGANRSLMAINIPQSADLESIRSYLIDCDVEWEHADPTYDALFPQLPNT